MAVPFATLSFQLVCLAIILGAFSLTATTIVAQTVVEPTIPNDYTVSRDLNVAFKVHTEARTWEEAKRICENEHAVLAAVDNMEEIRFIAGMKTPNTYVWIGASRSSSTSSWMSVKTNTAMTQIPWAPGKPWGSHNCMAIRGCNRGMTNENCAEAKQFVCEMARGGIQPIAQ